MRRSRNRRADLQRDEAVLIPSRSPSRPAGALRLVGFFSLSFRGSLLVGSRRVAKKRRSRCASFFSSYDFVAARVER
jgi:hypothetical protein